jgi:chromosome segregation ATPase
MSNEQESMPKMQASQEDMAMRQKQLQQRRLAAQRAAKANPAAAQVAAPAPKQTLAIIALILSVAMGGFAGFLFMQLQEANAQLSKAEGILNGHATNLAALNDKLSASDENANLSVDALKILLKDNGKEIRKLWDLTNKTNKPNIAKNNKAISGVKASIAKVDKKAASVDRKVANVDSKVANANSAIAGNKKNIGSNKNSIADLKASIALHQNAMEDKLAQVKSSANGLPAATEKRINDNEQSIRSIDATRKKLNSSMAEVESQFNEMKLEIEDIQIRLDRMQNAMTGTL